MLWKLAVTVTVFRGANKLPSVHAIPFYGKESDEEPGAGDLAAGISIDVWRRAGDCKNHAAKQ
jgi:hypothetical protein